MKKLSPEGAKKLHEVTNLAYWLGNPEWLPDSRAGAIACKAYRLLPLDPYELIKRHIFGPEVIAINGESVVAHPAGSDLVNKHMFRVPVGMTLREFETKTREEVALTSRYLSDVALPTSVTLTQADVFRHGLGPVEAVTQIQPYLDLKVHRPLLLDGTNLATSESATDVMAKDLEFMLSGVAGMMNEGYIPDLGPSSGNLQYDPVTGKVKLIDVMPAYLEGGRLIGDSASIVPGTLDTLASIENFVGQFGRD